MTATDLTEFETRMLTYATARALTRTEGLDLQDFLGTSVLPNGYAARVQAVTARIIERRIGTVEDVLTEWGATGDGPTADAGFAEAIADSGAWRFARDLRAALRSAGEEGHRR